MRLTISERIFAIACAAAMWSCGDSRSPVSPLSVAPLTAPSSKLTVRPLDEELPAPDPELVPPPDPVPAPDPNPAPAQVALTISIVGSFGTNAFTPNPIQASVGDMLVWTNSDRTMHHIVLDDGTVIGDVAPGESSVPVPLTSATATYYCTIHPTMVGSISGDAAPGPPTSTSPQPPDGGLPPPDFGPPPPDGGYDYYRYRRRI